MAQRSITDIRAALVGSGARPNLFQISLTFPSYVSVASGAGTVIPFMAEATQLPVDKLGEIVVGFMGRKLYYPGDREFDPWTITVINDENNVVRDGFEQWMSGLNSHLGNVRDPAAAVPAGYSVDGFINQLSKIDSPAVKQYAMRSCFPTELGAIELDWNTNDTIEKFQVTLRYQWWESLSINGPTTDGSPGPLAG